MSGYQIVTYRGAELPANYVSVVYSRWLRSLRYGNDHFRMMDKDAYFNHYHAYIERVLRRPDTAVRLAVLADEPDVVLGWAVHSGATLYYLHVQREMRRQGIARALLPPDTREVANMTRDGMSVWANKAPHWRFNPWGCND